MVEAPKDKSGVFVRGISFAVDQQAVEAAFANVGPIRKCFLVQEKGQEKHKGYGFVQFAIPDDADRAVKELHNTVLGDRQIQVEHSNKRAPFAERKRKYVEAVDPAASSPSEAPAEAVSEPAVVKQPDAAVKDTPVVTVARVKQSAKSAPKRNAPARDLAAEKQRLVRTIALGNLSASTRVLAVKLARDAGKVTQVIDPASSAVVDAAKLLKDGCKGEVVFIEYDTVKAATDAVAQLHGALIQEAATKRQKTEEPGSEVLQKLWARQVAGEGAHMKKWRVIIRNLPFQVKDDVLRSALQVAGFVWELTVPRNAEGKSRGFAFAGFTCRSHAEKVIALMNGQKLSGRTVAVDWAIAKAEFQRSEAVAEKAKAVEKIDSEDDDNDEADSDSEDDKDAEEGSQLSEDDVEVDPSQEKAMQHSLLDSMLGGGTGRGAASEESSEDDADDNGRAAAEPEDEEEEAELPAAAAVVVQLPDHRTSSMHGNPTSSAFPHEQQLPAERTVFIRGLPLDVTQQQLQSTMMTFGPVKACRLVMNKALQKPKGTAFVEFRYPEGAAKAAASAERQRDGNGAGVRVGGQVVEVDLALTQQAARTLAVQKDVKGNPKDNRNLYLAKEGHIQEGSGAWEEMSANDRNRRSRAASEKNLKLRSPNFFVSTTRLSVRNLPPSLDEKALKKLVVLAVRERAVKEVPHVKQVKILRETGKVGDSDSKSKGLAFVEFTEHEHALCALRQLNNNPIPFGKERRPIIEFAIENVNILQKRQLRQKMADSTISERVPRRVPSAAQHVQVGDRKSAALPDKMPPRAVKAPPAKLVKVTAVRKPTSSLVAAHSRPKSDVTVGAATREQQRKRKVDTRFDALAESGAGDQKRLKQGGKPSRVDKFEDLVDKYKQKFFGQANDSIKRSAVLDKRWFD